MDGVVVAYHNTERMFGFHYIPLEEMDQRLFGPGEGVGDRVFRKCIAVMEQVADEITRCFPEQVRCCSPSFPALTYYFSLLDVHLRRLTRL